MADRKRRAAIISTSDDNAAVSKIKERRKASISRNVTDSSRTSIFVHRSRAVSSLSSIAPKMSTPFILLPYDEKQKVMQSSESVMSQNFFRQYKVQEHYDKICEKLKCCFNLDIKTIRNVVAYTRSLPIAGTVVIDKNIFNAQMMRHFDLTNRIFLDKMYLVCCKDSKTSKGKVHLPEYAELICIFISGDLDLQTQFAFQVYVRRTDNILIGRDLDFYVNNILEEYAYTDDGDREELKTFLGELLYSYDTNKNSSLDMDEYMDIVRRKPLMLQMLGPCLPDKPYSDKFKALLEGKSTLECGAQFRFERAISLRGPKSYDTSDVQKYYSVKLDLV